MGTLKGVMHSGRPNKTSTVYTRTNKKTGRCHTVEIRNPNTNWTEKQVAGRNVFGLKNSAVSAWIRTNKEESAEGYRVYRQVKSKYDRQNVYASLRGYMIGKGMAEVLDDGSVKIVVGTYSVNVIV